MKRKASSKDLSNKRGRPSSPLAKVDSSEQNCFECPLCLDSIREAFMTQCGHSFCHRCITAYLETEKSCPTCFSPLGKTQIFPNFMLNKLIEKNSADNYLKAKSPNFDKKVELNLLMQFLNATKETKESEQSQLCKELEVISKVSTFVNKKIIAIEKSDLQKTDQINNTTPQHQRQEDLLHQESSTPVPIDSLIKRNSKVTSTTTELTVPDGSKSIINDIGDKLPLEDSKDAFRVSLATKDEFKRLEKYIPCLQDFFFSERIIDDSDSDQFAESFTKFCKYSKLKTIANLHYSDSFFNNSSSIVSSIEFDKDDEFFATAGVTRKIKVFEFANVVHNYTESSKQPIKVTTNFISTPRSTSSSGSSDNNSDEEDDDDEDDDDDEENQSPQSSQSQQSSTAEQEDHAPGAHDGVSRFPVLEIQCKSKISCLSWNSYIKTHLLSSDYEGVVALWDSGNGKEVGQFNEHEKRVWSVDFSAVDPKVFASGGDDTKVKIWSTSQKNSVHTISTKANICSVKFNPEKSHQIAFGSADHHIHYYDLRSPNKALETFKGHRKAVSYVKFVNPNEIISASTDCTLRLWDVNHYLNTRLRNPTDSIFFENPTDFPTTRRFSTRSNIVNRPFFQTGGRTGSTSATLGPNIISAFSNSGSTSANSSDPNTTPGSLLRTFEGHLNEKNFVGLSVNSTGEYIACGSETNQVYVYFNKIRLPVCGYAFGNPIDPVTGNPGVDDDPTQFVSSVCWMRKREEVLVAANSQGRIKVLEMV